MSLAPGLLNISLGLFNATCYYVLDPDLLDRSSFAAGAGGASDSCGIGGIGMLSPTGPIDKGLLLVDDSGLLVGSVLAWP